MVEGKRELWLALLGKMGWRLGIGFLRLVALRGCGVGLPVPVPPEGALCDLAKKAFTGPS